MNQFPQKIECSLREGDRDIEEYTIDRFFAQPVIHYRVVYLMLREWIQTFYNIGVGKIEHPCHPIHVSFLSDILNRVAYLVMTLAHDMTFHKTVVLYVIKQLITFEDNHYQTFFYILALSALSYFNVLFHTIEV